MLAAGNQLLWYQYEVSSVSPIYTGKELHFLAFDQLSNRVYASAEQMVMVFDIPSGQLISSFDLGEEILNIHLIYNK